MKKRIAWLTALLALTMVLTMLLQIPAIADGNTMYVNKDVLKAYKDPDSNSKVVKKLKGGTKVKLSPNVLVGSSFVNILIEDTKHGGQMEAFVQAKYLSDTMPQEYCKHKWGKWKVTREATCTEKGKREHTCKVCGKVEKESIKATGHEWGKWKVTKEATCVKKGTRKRTCKVCGEVEKEKYLDEHTYGSWKVTLEPTCTEKGERERICKVCGHVQTQALDKLPHDYEWRVTLEPTDHSSGTRAKICKVCGKDGGEESFDPEGTLRRKDRGDDVRAMQQLLYEQGYLNAGGVDGIFGGGCEKALMQYQKDRGLNPDGIAWPQTLKDLQHDFSPWETVTEMTRAQAGERVRVCQGCGFEQRETLEPGTVYVKGDRGEAIRALQQMIKVVGYDAGSFDGIYGRKLDAALAGFAEANGLVVEEGKVRPADVDAVVNAWLDTVPADEWMGEGDSDSPVDLALTVTPTSEADDSGMVSYSWSLTNLGSERATFTTLLLTFGKNPNFRSNDLVMVIDGVDLKADANNSTSGSFSVDMDWGEGNLNFAALAVSDSTGKKWLSNTVVFESAASDEPKTALPLPVDLDVTNLPNGVYPVSFDPGDIAAVNSGTYMNAVHFYTMDTYDGKALRNLRQGDTVLFGEDAVTVNDVEVQDDSIVINGTALVPTGDGDTYRLQLYGDIATYTDHGATTVLVDPSATFIDSADLDRGKVTIGYDELVNAMQSADDIGFNKYNTTLTIEGGKVTGITRVYTE